MYLRDKFGNEGYLDMKNAKFSQRYKPYLKLLIKQLNLHLQPMTSLKETKFLVAIANCKSKKDIDDL
jgi:hypothetical protein